MFIVFGILNVLAGCFVFLQSAFIGFIASLADESNEIGGSFSIVGLSLIVAGAMMIASNNGVKSRFISSSVCAYIVSFLVSVSHFNIGVMAIWTIVSAGMVIFLILWVLLHPDPNKKLPKKKSFYSPEIDKKDDQK